MNMWNGIYLGMVHAWTLQDRRRADACVHVSGNCFAQCALRAATSLDGAVPCNWEVAEGGTLEDQAADLRVYLRGRYTALLAEARAAQDGKSCADYERVLGSLANGEHVYEEAAQLLLQYKTTSPVDISDIRDQESAESSQQRTWSA